MATADFAAAAAAARLILAGEKNSERESRRVNARGSGEVVRRFSSRGRPQRGPSPGVRKP